MSLRQLIADVFRIAPDQVTDDLSPDTLRAWDSMGHLGLVSALETAYSLQLTDEEVADMTSVAQVKAVLAKRGVAP